jgi:hypothetical protein
MVYISSQNLNNFLLSRVIQKLHHDNTELKGFYFIYIYLLFICSSFKSIFLSRPDLNTFKSYSRYNNKPFVCHIWMPNKKTSPRACRWRRTSIIVTAIFLSTRTHRILFAMSLKCVSLSSLAQNPLRLFSKECSLTHQNIKIPARKRKPDKELCVFVCVYVCVCSQHIQRDVICTVK